MKFPQSRAEAARGGDGQRREERETSPCHCRCRRRPPAPMDTGATVCLSIIKRSGRERLLNGLSPPFACRRPLPSLPISLFPLPILLQQHREERSREMRQRDKRRSPLRVPLVSDMQQRARLSCCRSSALLSPCFVVSVGPGPQIFLIA